MAQQESPFGRGTPSAPIGSSTTRALERGYLAATVSGQSNLYVDPRDYGSDAAAIQAAHDQLQSAMQAPHETGYVHIPAVRPDGSAWRIDSTVTFAGEGTVLPRGHGFGSNIDGAALVSEITDGSPMVQITSMQAQVASFGGLRFDGNENDCEGLRCDELTAVRGENMDFLNFDGVGNGGNGQGCLVIDQECDNNFWFNLRFNNAGSGGSKSNALAFRQSGTGEIPTEQCFFGVSTYAPVGTGANPFNNIVDMPINARGTQLFGCRFEGAGGDATIHAPAGDLWCHNVALGTVEGTNVDGIYFGGDAIVASALRTPAQNTTGGSHVVLDTPNYARIDPFPDNVSGGFAVQVLSDGPTTKIVPRESHFDAACDYPADDWQGLRFHDGYQINRQGTSTIAASSTTSLTTFGGAVDEGELRITHKVAADPNGEPRYRPVFGWDDANNEQFVGIEETAGVGFDLEYTIERQA